MSEHRPVTRILRALSMGLPLVAISIGGCGGERGPERVVVSGTVAYKGQPISNGRIRFVPDANSNVPSTAAKIVEGRYRADLHGGVPVGKHNVEIEAYQKASAAPNPMGIPQNYLPKRHGADSQVWVTIEPGSREIVKNFDLAD